LVLKLRKNGQAKRAANTQMRILMFFW